MRLLIEGPRVVEDEPNIFTELKGCEILIFIQFLHDGRKIHRILDDIEVARSDCFCHGLTKPAAIVMIIQTMKDQLHLLPQLVRREDFGMFHQRFAASIDLCWPIDVWFDFLIFDGYWLNCGRCIARRRRICVRHFLFLFDQCCCCRCLEKKNGIRVVQRWIVRQILPEISSPCWARFVRFSPVFHRDGCHWFRHSNLSNAWSTDWNRWWWCDVCRRRSLMHSKDDRLVQMSSLWRTRASVIRMKVQFDWEDLALQLIDQSRIRRPEGSVASWTFASLRNLSESCRFVQPAVESNLRSRSLYCTYLLRFVGRSSS